MAFFEFRKANHLAILGFLCPFIAAGTTAVLLLGRAGASTPFHSSYYLMLIPAVLMGGLVFSLKSIRRIEALGDKDYAYSGLVLNLLFMVLYLMSIAISIFT